MRDGGAGYECVDRLLKISVSSPEARRLRPRVPHRIYLSGVVRGNAAFSKFMISEHSTGRFIADTGINVPAVSSEQMRELDRIATEETGPSLLQMMENAGRSLALVAIELMGPRWRSARVVILAGSG